MVAADPERVNDAELQFVQQEQANMREWAKQMEATCAVSQERQAKLHGPGTTNQRFDLGTQASSSKDTNEKPGRGHRTRQETQTNRIKTNPLSQPVENTVQQPNQ